MSPRPSPAIIEVVTAAVRAANDAGHGGKTAIYKDAADKLGISLSQFHRYRKELTVQDKKRKQRSDAGSSELTRDEALVISGVIMETLRTDGRRLGSVSKVIEALRENDLIKAERVDKETGELIKLSDSAIQRALRSYKLHPEQLLRPSAHNTMKAGHPNKTWQIDASLCVLYYLKPDKRTGNGLQVMKSDEFYKNKPKNLQRIMADRVWSYEITDHATGWIYVEYVMGAESGENLCSVLINAMQERGGADVMHGVPKVLYMDPGSANTSAMAKNLCNALGIKAIAHAPGNARATGQVENARRLIETQFEFGLKFQPVADLEELNALAKRWRCVWNAKQVHSRHKMTRTNAWLKIREDQLVKAPPVEVCRDLATKAPVERKVTAGGYGHYINLDGEKYDVSHLEVETGEKLLITRNPWRKDSVQALMTDDEGHQVIKVLPVIVMDEWNTPDEAPEFGESFKAPAESAGQKALKEIEQIMTGTDSVEAAEKARKAKEIPLGGRFDPFKSLDTEQLPEFISKRGTEHDLKAPKVETVPLSVTQIAKRLSKKMGNSWTPENFAWLKQRYPDGAQESELDDIEQQLRKPQSSPLKLVNGG